MSSALGRSDDLLKIIENEDLDANITNNMNWAMEYENARGFWTPVIRFAYWLTYRGKIIFNLLLYFAAMASVYYYYFNKFSEKKFIDAIGWALPIAKGCAGTIYISGSLLWLCSCRRLILYLRGTFLYHFIAFDEHVTFHM